jgi:RNA polymerase sigma factor (sigma-70 family)
VAAVPSIGRASRVERSAAPGAEATSELYERYSSQIFGYCLHQLGSREEAEDAAQTTFMNAFRGLARGIVPDVEQAWLFKIAHNVCLSRRRSSWRRGRVEAPNNMEVLQEVVPAKEKVADELIRLQDVLEEMPESQRRAILLREWQGLSYREIAEELELSQAAVETLIFRARRALAAGLEEAPGVWRKRLRRGADAGGALAFVKAMLGGGGAAAVKVAALVALAGAAVATGAAGHMRPQHRAPAPAKPSARDVTRLSAAPSSAAPAQTVSAPVAIHRDAAPHSAPALRAAAPTPSSPAPVTVAATSPAPQTPSAPAPQTPAPAPTVVQPQTPPASAAATTSKGQGKRGGRPDGAPPQRVAKGNPHSGQDDLQTNSAPPAPDPAPAATAPGNSGDHGQSTAPGQEDKGDAGASPHGNGRGK